MSKRTITSRSRSLLRSTSIIGIPAAGLMANPASGQDACQEQPGQPGVFVCSGANDDAQFISADEVEIRRNRVFRS